MKIEIDVDIPEGFEATGEHRRVFRGEHYLTPEGNAVCLNLYDMTGKNYIILRKVPRKPTAEHVGQRIEVKDFDTWRERTLVAVTPEGYWCLLEGSSYEAFLWPDARVIE